MPPIIPPTSTHFHILHRCMPTILDPTHHPTMPAATASIPMTMQAPHPIASHAPPDKDRTRWGMRRFASYSHPTAQSVDAPRPAIEASIAATNCTGFVRRFNFINSLHCCAPPLVVQAHSRDSAQHAYLHRCLQNV